MKGNLVFTTSMETADMIKQQQNFSVCCHADSRSPAQFLLVWKNGSVFVLWQLHKAQALDFAKFTVFVHYGKK